MRNDRSDISDTICRLALVVDKRVIPSFFPLLQQGVLVRCRVGCSIAAFLREDIGATAGTINKIQSVILDGKPVDDIELAFLKDGSTLALSAAMPGLVGATLRRGGAYASFRSAITHHETEKVATQEDGHLRIKLFNLLMAELGPAMLCKGVVVSRQEIIGFMANQPDEFWEDCKQITLGDISVDAGKLRGASWLSGKDRILLVVTHRHDCRIT